MAVTAALTNFAQAIDIKKAGTATPLVPLEVRMGGRTLDARDEAGHSVHRFQWPGVYFEAAFSGSAIHLITGAGHAKFDVSVDQQPPQVWLNPGPGTYVIDGLADGPHTIRVELITECQGGSVDFGGFAVTSAAHAGHARALPRRIEFIGDSHTVGYGNTSKKRECTEDEVWSTTDTSQAFGVLVAKHYGADYRINAISGRGIVRNYGGFVADPLPAAYPYVLFDKKAPARDTDWDPQLIVIGLGTNDFSTPLKPEEKWKSREALRADYEQTYVRFVQQLRERHPHAFLLLAANDGAEGEIAAEVRKVMAQLVSARETRIGFIMYPAMELTACNWHPSLADHRKMAATVTQFIDSHPDLW
jgi:lysophospholipase L1-like esterase